MKKLFTLALFSSLLFGCDSERGPDQDFVAHQAGNTTDKTEEAYTEPKEPGERPAKQVQGDANLTSGNDSSSVGESPVLAEPKEPGEVPPKPSSNPAPKDETVKVPTTPTPEKEDDTEPVASSPPHAFPETVLVGNPGNPADTTGFGSVPYVYRIGKFEVTNSEYCEFLNAAAKKDSYRLYDRRMTGGHGGIMRSGKSGSYSYDTKVDGGKKPVGYVTWDSCARYANWLSNGGGDADLQKGSYLLKGGIQPKVTLPDHGALAAGKGTQWVIASENEWYKAAYYDPAKPGGAGYWPFAVSGGSAPASNINSNQISVAGAFKVASPYGTYDQNGNLWEYNEARNGNKVGLRGGSFFINDNEGYLRSQTRYDVLSAKWPNYGFRVVALGGDGQVALLRSKGFPEAKDEGFTSFEKVDVGSFEELDTAIGTWKAGDRNQPFLQVLINNEHFKTGKQCLHLTGGEKATVTLELADKFQVPGQLTFWAERWTRNLPFSFRIEADQGKGWKEIYDGDKEVRVGRAFLSHVKVLLPVGVKRLQFICSSPPKYGILIDDVRFIPNEPQGNIVVADLPPTPPKTNDSPKPPPEVKALPVPLPKLPVRRVKTKTYYVSQSSGNDDWNGEASLGNGKAGPWKTLARASIEYLPGDVLLLKRGDVWHEELRPKGNGTPEQPISISAYGVGSKPVIDREDYNQDRTGIRLSDQGGFKIVGIEFNRCMTGIYADYSDNGKAREYLWIEDCYFHDSLKYQHYEDYPKRKIGLGVCLFSHERDKRIVMSDITVKNCVFRRLASGFWTNNPDNFNKNASYVYNFKNLVFDSCLFEEGFQWQQGIRGVDTGVMRNCVTHDIGRGFRSFNGVAGSMFFRCKNWVFEDCEWGFVSIGLGSGDGEAFDFEGNCDNMIMRNCLFHDTDGPGFLLCCYASDGHAHSGIIMENCVINGKSKRPIGLPRCAIVNTTDWNESTWRKCRFYLSKGEAVMRVMDPEKDKKTTFIDCRVKDLVAACSSKKLWGNSTESKEDAEEFWIQLNFGKKTNVNEFLIKEREGSSISRYVIELWDVENSTWKSCFNGLFIGTEFVAPIVERKTTKARLRVIGTKAGKPQISEFSAFKDPLGEEWNVKRGDNTPNRVGKTRAEWLASTSIAPAASEELKQVKPVERVLAWDTKALFEKPKVHQTKERPAKGLRSFFYEGANYKGKPTKVFAYYGAPDGKVPEGGWPAVVCAHGGGGTAYPEWVKFWNKKGYAAIAMDLEGHLPGGNSHQVAGNFPTGVGHLQAGPSRIDWFGDRGLPDQEQWFYHAVADVVRANSLLRSYPEINPEKIGLTGISWGGTVASSVAGVDTRFAFAIPVYGGGYIHESDNEGLAQWFPPKNMTDAQFRDYRAKWDPSAHLPHAKMPMLWVTSVADPVFQIDIFAKSSQTAAGDSRLCMRPWMIHGHGNGWNDAPEIGQFADSIVKGGPVLPKLHRPETKPANRIVHTKYEGKGKFTEAWIYYTTSEDKWKNRKWHFIQCSIGDEELVSQKALPQTTTAFLVYVFRDKGGYRDNHAASHLVEL
jgi:dienelactone hydrolase/formylglycine-generating enzyme required for sulfatase activity